MLMDQLHDITPVESRLVAKATLNRIPISASFELTPLCNLNCEMCYVRMNSEKLEYLGGEKKLDYWIRVAEELKSLGTLFILLTGGEPLLYPEFRELYTLLREMGFIVSINTNATLIDEKTAELFSKVRPRRINVSLYGASKDTYIDLCHSSVGFERCISGLSLLKKYNIDTKLNLTIVRKNKKDYESVIRIAEKLEMPASINCYTSLFCSNTCTSQRDIPQQRLTSEEVAMMEIEHLRYKYKSNYKEHIKEMHNAISKYADSAIPNGISLSCRAGKSSCWINWQGIMSPCVDIPVPSVSLETSTVSDAWQTIVKECESLPFHTECSGCKLSKLCDVCYANATNEKKYCGNISYLCGIGKAKRLIIEKESQQ